MPGTPRHLVIEQPELCLHPRAMHRLADILVDAVNRGAQVVLETHSELLLMDFQTALADGRLEPVRTSFNWFALDEKGHSRIHRADMQPDGSFGDWPADFLDVEAEAQRRYLDAAERRRRGRPAPANG